MCRDSESILTEAAVTANDHIRNASWKRVKTELEIMRDTLENSGADIVASDFFEQSNDFIQIIEDNCYHQ